MDEEKNQSKIVSAKGKMTCACGEGCNCGCGCGCGYRCGHRLIWWALGVLLLVIVFAFGVKAGEFKIELRDVLNQGYYHEYPMMQGGQDGPMQPVGSMENGSTTMGTGPIIQ